MGDLTTSLRNFLDRILPGSTDGFVFTATGIGNEPDWEAPTGGGGVTGPGTSVDGEVVLFDGATGDLLKRAFAAVGDFVYSAIATTRTTAARVVNKTAATAGVPVQISPALVFESHGWDTDGGGSDTTLKASVHATAFSAANPNSHLSLQFDPGTGTFQEEFRLGQIENNDTASFRIRNGNILFSNNARGIYFTANPLTDSTPTSHYFQSQSDGGIKFVPQTQGTGGSYIEVEQNMFGGGSAGTWPAIRVRLFDDATAVPQMAFRSRAVPGGTAAVGFGSKLSFQASSNTTANQDQGSFDCVWNTATHASRSADFVMQLVDGAAALAEKYRFASTGLATLPSINLSSGSLGNIAAGTYTPTRSAESNLDANVTMTEAQYLRVGATVTVSGRFTANPTTAATATSFEITLPVASNIGAAEDVAGVAFCGAVAGQGAEIIGVAANDTAKVQWAAGDVASRTWSYTFSYQII